MLQLQSCHGNAADEGAPNQNYFYEQFLSDSYNGLIHDCEIISIIYVNIMLIMLILKVSIFLLYHVICVIYVFYY